jgi:GTPase-associated system-like protein
VERLENVFAKWYSLVVPSFSAEQLHARLKSISQLTHGLATADVLKLVRQFYRLPVDSGYVQTLRKAIDDHDKKYVQSDDAAELAVIAGGVVYSAASESSHLADAVSLAVFCTEAVGMRKVERIDEVVKQCYQYLQEEGIRVREKKETAPKLSTDFFAEAVGNLKNQYPQGLPVYAPLLETALLQLNTALGAYSTSLAQYVERMEQHRTEESNILYWLLGQRTRDGRRYADVEIKKAAIVVATDLAGMTGFLPGPVGAPAFMKQLLEQSPGDVEGMVTISKCVDTLTPPERKMMASNHGAKDAALMPILFAISKAEESGGTGWTSAFSTQTGLDPTSEVKPIKIAEQVYSELLLLRAIS